MRRLALMVLTALLLTGCTAGSDGGKDGGRKDAATSGAAPKPTGPACDGIWEAGETLPDGYKSCVLGGAVAEQEVYECEDDTKLIVFNDSMYAVTGGEIIEPEIQPFQDTDEYGKVYAECTGK